MQLTMQLRPESTYKFAEAKLSTPSINFRSPSTVFDTVVLYSIQYFKDTYNNIVVFMWLNVHSFSYYEKLWTFSHRKIPVKRYRQDRIISGQDVQSVSVRYDSLPVTPIIP